ncbi:Phosphatidylinositol transfer protein beta isoform, partial [Paramicrosporidium saccamoebae]
PFEILSANHHSRIPMPLTVEEVLELLTRYKPLSLSPSNYSKLPRIVQALAPGSALKVEERAWNAYPHCKTIISNPFLGESFEICLESLHLPDSGESENVAPIHIVNPKACSPVMCAYKLVTIKFKIFGLQTKMENFIENTEWGILLKFHKQVFTLIDEWIDLSIEDIRQMEVELKKDLDQYQVGQLHAIAEASREETNGDTGVEILANEPFDNERGSGQYTHKNWYLSSNYSSHSAEFHNPFLKDRFNIVVESRHIDDSGATENAFNLNGDELQRRKIIWIDIAGDVVNDNPPHLEPAEFLSEQTNRGKLQGEWWADCSPVMCCYKLVTIKFQNQRELLTKFHKKVFCSIDKWHGLTMDDIRILEDQMKQELEQKISDLGMKAGSDSKSRESAKSTPY